MAKHYQVYRYYQPETGMSYIGMTANPLNQRAGNKKTGVGYKTTKKFWPAIQKYGFKTFEREVLTEVTTLAEAEYWEKFYIQIFDSIAHGYNESIGGGGGSGCHHKISSDHLEKMLTPRRKKVQQFTLQGTLVKEFSSLREAERETGVHHENISKCCSGQLHSTGDYLWRKV